MQDPDQIIQEWRQFAEMDLSTAKHLNATMQPKPLEIICYHCQQSAEKILKAVLIKQGKRLVRTHDLGLLIESIAEDTTVEDDYYEACDELTPYGVNIRYPQEISVSEYHVKKAIEAAERINVWACQILDEQVDEENADE